MEDVMKMITQMSIATTFVAGMLGASICAYATDTSQAIKLCDANPNCTMKWGKQNDSITITVKGSGVIIDCPKVNGPCVAVRFNPSNFGHPGEGGNGQAHENNNDGRGGDRG
jgi:hypothetical protein